MSMVRQLMSNMGSSRYEPHYVPGGTYQSPAPGVLVVVCNDGSGATLRDLSEYDLARAATWLEERGFRHAAA